MVYFHNRIYTLPERAMLDTTIRLATIEDLHTINAIYNFYVDTSTCTYQVEIEPDEVRLAAFLARTEVHPVTVAVQKGEVVGWGALSRHRYRDGYDCTVENSVYLNPNVFRQGIGRELMLDLIARAKVLGHHSIVGVISADQTASLELHRALGFAQVAYIPQAGYKFDSWLDVVYMQLML